MRARFVYKRATQRTLSRFGHGLRGFRSIGAYETEYEIFCSSDVQLNEQWSWKDVGVIQ